MGLGDEVELAIFLRDAGTVVAGISGWTWGDCCELQSLWVEPRRRGRGPATRLPDVASRAPPRAVVRGQCSRRAVSPIVGVDRAAPCQSRSPGRRTRALGRALGSQTGRRRAHRRDPSDGAVGVFRSTPALVGERLHDHRGRRQGFRERGQSSRRKAGEARGAYRAGEDSPLAAHSPQTRRLTGTSLMLGSCHTARTTVARQASWDREGGVLIFPTERVARRHMCVGGAAD